MIMEQCLPDPTTLHPCPYGCPDGCVADFGKMIEKGQVGLATKRLEAKVHKHKQILRSGTFNAADRRLLMGNMVWDQVRVKL